MTVAVDMGLSFITPSDKEAFIPIQIESSSISSESSTSSASTTVSYTASTQIGASSTFSTVTGSTKISNQAAARNELQINASFTGQTDSASNSGENIFASGRTTSSTFASGTLTGSASGTLSDSGSSTQSSSRGFTDQTIISGSIVAILATTQDADSSTGFSTTAEAIMTVGISGSVMRNAVVKRIDTTTALTQSFASYLTTSPCLTSTTTTVDEGTRVATASSTTTSTMFATAWSTSVNSKITTVAPSTQRFRVVTVESISDFSVVYGNSPVSVTVHVAENSPFDPLGVGLSVNAGNVVIDNSKFEYSKSKGKASFIKGDKTYSPQTYEEDQNVTFITVNATDATDTIDMTVINNPAHLSSVSSFELLGSESRTFCNGSTTSTYIHVIPTTSEQEEGDLGSYVDNVFSALTTTTINNTTVVSTTDSIVNINVESVNHPTIFTTKTIKASTTVDTTFTTFIENGAVIVGNITLNTSTTGEGDGASFTNERGYTFANDSNRAILIVQGQSFRGGALVKGTGMMTFLKTRSVAGYAPFNAETRSRPIVFLGFTTSMESSEGFASWQFFDAGGVQRFKGVTFLDDNPCRTVSETYTHSDVTFQQTVTNKDDLQFFDSTVTEIDSDLNRVTSAVSASTSTSSTLSTDIDGNTVSTTKVIFTGHSVPNTTTTSALVTMSRTWTTGFMTDDANTSEDASVRSLTYRGRYGNKGTIVVELCESIDLESYEMTSAAFVFRGPVTATVRPPYHLVGTLRDSSSTSTTEFFNGDRNILNTITEQIELDSSVEYSFEQKSMVAPMNGSPALIDANTYDANVFTVLSVDED